MEDGEAVGWVEGLVAGIMSKLCIIYGDVFLASEIVAVTTNDTELTVTLRSHGTESVSFYYDFDTDDIEDVKAARELVRQWKASME